jgi:hypothetical protein
MTEVKRKNDPASSVLADNAAENDKDRLFLHLHGPLYGGKP